MWSFFFQKLRLLRNFLERLLGRIPNLSFDGEKDEYLVDDLKEGNGRCLTALIIASEALWKAEIGAPVGFNGLRPSGCCGLLQLIFFFLCFVVGLFFMSISRRNRTVVQHCLRGYDRNPFEEQELKSSRRKSLSMEGLFDDNGALRFAKLNSIIVTVWRGALSVENVECLSYVFVLSLTAKISRNSDPPEKRNYIKERQQRSIGKEIQKPCKKIHTYQRISGSI